MRAKAVREAAAETGEDSSLLYGLWQTDAWAPSAAKVPPTPASVHFYLSL